MSLRVGPIEEKQNLRIRVRGRKERFDLDKI